MKLALIAALPLTLSLPALVTAQTKPRPPAPAAAPVTATITVTDSSGTPLADVHVILTGSLDRSGSTQPNGMVKFDGLRPGVYRLRFERDIEVRAGQPPPSPSVVLSPAPPPPPPPPAPAPPPAPGLKLPPAGKATVIDVPDFAMRN